VVPCITRRIPVRSRSKRPKSTKIQDFPVTERPRVGWCRTLVLVRAYYPCVRRREKKGSGTTKLGHGGLRWPPLCLFFFIFFLLQEVNPPLSCFKNHLIAPPARRLGEEREKLR
jgi:hypothetical protein